MSSEQKTEKDKAKKTYVKPELVIHGTLAKITGANMSGGSDGILGDMGVVIT